MYRSKKPFKTFTSKADAFSRSKRSHFCTACRHNQKITWGDDPCPECGRMDTRRFFSSEKEMQRAASLLLLRDQGKITDLRFQPRYKIAVENVEICTYVSDFEYRRDGKVVIEDVKPEGNFIDDLSNLKIKLFEAVYKTRVSLYR